MNLRQRIKISEWYFLLPVIFFTAVIPLIVSLKINPLSDTISDMWDGLVSDNDVFSYYKMVFILIMGLLTVVLLLYKSRREGLEIKKTNYYIPIGIYLLFLYASTFLSEYRSLALYGSPGRYEGMLVIMVYIVMLFAVINLVNAEKHVKVIVVALIVCAFVIGVLGIFQFFGFNYVESEVGKRIIMLFNYSRITGVKYEFGPYTIYSTMYNPNYVGSYTAMLLPLSITLCILLKNRTYKILTGLFSCLMFANWIGCHSRGGIIGGVFAVVILFVLIRKHLLKNIVYLAGLAVCYVLIFTIMNYASNGGMTGNVDRLNADFSAAITSDSGSIPLRDVYTGQDSLTVVNKDSTFVILLEKDNAVFKEQNGKIMEALQEQKKAIKYYRLSDSRYKDYTFMYHPELRVFQIGLPGAYLNFTIEKDGVKYIDYPRKLVDLKPVNTLDFHGKEYLASGRLYIWSRAVPMLTDTLILGKGPDTFAAYFPQNDFVGKLLWLGRTKIIVDKPHNLYLQIGLSTGVLSLICILVLFAAYFISSTRLYISRRLDSLFEMTGVGAFAAFCGYAVTGFFNDSVVSVAPVFWVLFGLGICMNLKLKSAAGKNKIPNKTGDANNKEVCVNEVQG